MRFPQKWQLMGLLCAAMLVPTAQAQTAFKPVEFQNASVHDPSIIRVDNNYYVFGSHLAAAKTSDLMNWQLIAAGVNNANPLFNNVLTELSETLAWAQSDTLWAPDVIKLADGRYYMYYNACKGDSPRSALGIAVANQVEGPYVNQGIILKSGMWGLASEDGTIYNALKHPNTVDPNVFFDAGGKLWMVYGSYSGGIFILKLDPQTGKPIAGQGYGKRLIGGNHSRIEGAYILYSPQTSYYYLFTSFGGLDAAGGYNIRVARSTAPDGPYYDAAGNDMTNVKANASLPLFDDASITPYGVKLMGNYLFERKLGETGTGIGTGYVSPGHNSAYYDPATGKHFLIFHSRFPERGEQHEIRVHQMQMNADGWPVVAPYRYSNEGAFAPGTNLSLVAGDYMLVNHGKDITATIKKSQYVSLNTNGTVTGAATGTWSLAGKNQITLNLANSPAYKGMVTSNWDGTSNSYVMAFSALSSQGISIWGSRLVKKTDAQVVAAISSELSLGDTSAVTSNLTLPTSATRDSVISWTSSNPQVLSNAGVINRPAKGKGDALVTLTATITKGGASTTKSFVVVVREESIGGLIARYAFDNNLTDSTGVLAAGTVSGAFINTAGGSISYATGVKGSAAVFNGSSGVRLPNGIISKNTYTVSLWLNPDQLTEFTTTFFGARTTDAWVSLLPKGHGWVGNASMVWSGTAWYDAGLGMNIPVGQWSHMAFTVNNGTLKVYVNGVQKFSGTNFPNVFTNNTGVFSLGVNWWDTPYKGLMDELRIYEIALTAEEVAALSY